jgi:formylglycine-generating enzyme required for sulfatase activity
MAWPCLEKIRAWVAKRKRLLTGLVGVVVEETAACIPGAHLAVKIAGEVARHGVERFSDPAAAIADIKPAGQPFPTEQLDQINAWLQNLTDCYAGLLDRLEQDLQVLDSASDAEMHALVHRLFEQNETLAAEFAAHQVEVRRQTLSLTLVEEKLDEVLHGQHKLASGLEDLKGLFIHSPLWTDYHQFRKSHPDAVAAVVAADDHFLAGRREQGADELIALLKKRGIGEKTIAYRLGLEFLSRGKVAPARAYFDGARRAAKTMVPELVRTATVLDTAASRASEIAGWRSLPRGLILQRQYRIEDELGRGGMASVYRVVGVDRINHGEVFALKVPAPALMKDEATATRFFQEIALNAQLSVQPHPALVRTLGKVVFDDPHTGQELYGMVMEFVPGTTLAQLLALRREAKQPLAPAEIVKYLRPVCEALSYAHARKIYHRDLKPHNVMITPAGEARLMDFGIARVLAEGLSHVTQASQPGTPAYMPPEALAGGTFDERSEVYLAANLLVELLTFHPKGDPETRADCPPAWLGLIAAGMNQVRSQRPANIAAFQAALEGRVSAGPGNKQQPERKLGPPPAEDDWLRAGESVRGQAPYLEKQAREAADQRGDYAAAKALLERVPEDLRPAAYYNQVCDRAARVAELASQVRADWTAGRRKGLLSKVRVLHALQPSDANWTALLGKLEPKPGEVEKVEIAPGVVIPMVLVGKGTLWKGGEAGKPGQPVNIAHDFWIGIHPVTQRQWEAIMGSNPSHFKVGNGGGPDHPVEQVSWQDVEGFLARLNTKSAETGHSFRLPTEVEWEYSCRGGPLSSKTDSAFDFYFDRPTNELTPALANFNNTVGHTTKVGSYPSNVLGICDLHGSVWEWTANLHENDSDRVLRGGSWGIGASSCRASNRRGGDPSNRVNSLGFRLASVAVQQ